MLTVCMFVKARAAGGKRGGGLGGQPDGDCKAKMRDQPLSGHPQHLSTLCLSMSSMGPRSVGLSAGSTPYNASSTLRKGFYRHEEKTDKNQQTQSPSQSRV